MQTNAGIAMVVKLKHRPGCGQNGGVDVAQIVAIVQIKFEQRP